MNATEFIRFQTPSCPFFSFFPLLSLSLSLFSIYRTVSQTGFHYGWRIPTVRVAPLTLLRGSSMAWVGGCSMALCAHRPLHVMWWERERERDSQKCFVLCIFWIMLTPHEGAAVSTAAPGKKHEGFSVEAQSPRTFNGCAICPALQHDRVISSGIRGCAAATDDD